MIRGLLAVGVTGAVIGCLDYLATRTRLHFGLPDADNRIRAVTYIAGLAVTMVRSSVAQADPLIPAATLVAALCVSTASDLQFGYIFDAVSLPSMAVICLWAMFSGTIAQSGAGGAACAGVMLCIYAASMGRGIGLGDVKLAICIGLALGSVAGLGALGIAFVVGGAHATLLLLTGRARLGASLRFAPHLALGACFVLLSAKVPT